MDALLGWLPLLVCAAVMFVCLRYMSMGSSHQQKRSDDTSTQQEIAERREEVARLRAERALTGEQEETRG